MENDGCLLIKPIQSTEDAVSFYMGKVDDLTKNLKDLESIVQSKSKNLRVIEDGMQEDCSSAWKPC